MSVFAQTLLVFPSAAFRVIEGVNRGDCISFAAELMSEDVYTRLTGHERGRLTVQSDAGDDSFSVGPQSDFGNPGAELVIDSLATFMDGDGIAHEILLIVELIDGGVEEVYALPLGAWPETEERVLVGVTQDGAADALGEVACVAFARGTHLTMETGAQRLIEDIRVGERVLTRDDGPQEIKWIGMNTLRATGDHAPVLIKAGALNNLNDLRLSPEHRLFIYQRTDQLGTGRSEVFIRAHQLVNDTTILREPGGFVDYFQILFENHHIIYAEGIAAESMLIGAGHGRKVPSALRTAVQTAERMKREDLHKAFELGDAVVDQDTASLLKRASGR